MSLGNDHAPGLLPSGGTNVYGIVGHPVIQVKSPDLYNRHFAASAIDAVFVAFDLDPTRVESFFETVRGIQNFKGGFVTVPHKQAAASAMDELTDRAHVLGAVNVYKNEDGKLVGDMTDGPAFMHATKCRGFDPEGARVAMIGGGAAASAIAHACAEEGVRELILSVRRRERHPELRRIVESVEKPPRLSFELDDLGGFDLVINGTSVGMGDDRDVPHPTETLRSESLVADVVTMPRVTPWLQAALEKGCRVQYGAEMVAAQTQLVSPWWGIPAPSFSAN